MNVPGQGFALSYQPPFDWPSLLEFLAARATPGVESVQGGAYLRTVYLDGTTGIIEVTCDRPGERLLVRVTPGLEQYLPLLVPRVTHLFDLTADSAAISAHLGRDPLLASAVQAFPGIRVPGSWDPFETAVRAILGQVVSVKAATSLAGRLVARHGERCDALALDSQFSERAAFETRHVEQPEAEGDLTHRFPTAERLAEADFDGVGLSGQKIRAIRALARAVLSGSLRFDGFTSLPKATEALQLLPGIGAWTANYIAMRCLRQADAFPAGDLILRRAAAEANTTMSEADLLAVAQRWRPWRAYAAVLLWASYSRSSLKPAEPGVRVRTKAAE